MAVDRNIKKVDERARQWLFLVYPESCPENWRELINEYQVEWIESPLHDKDIDVEITEDGEKIEKPKKPHWHIVINYKGKKSQTQVSEITTRINATEPFKVHSLTGQVRYMAHIDNPEKYQYDRREIKGHNGAEVTKLLKPTSESRYECLGQMIEYIEANNITSFRVLSKYAWDERRDDWFVLLTDNSTMFINSYIKSKWQDNNPAIGRANE
jgi:hypothetical protein